MVIILSLGYAGISLLSPIYEGKMLGYFENFNKIQILKIALFLVVLRIIIEIKSIHTRRTWDRWIKAFQHILDFIFILISVYFITNNSLEISSFLIIFLYKNKVLDYISEIREKLADGKVSAQRVFDIITYKSFPKETYGDLNIENIKGSIEFKNVKFKYDSNSLFENLNFKINCNKMVAIVGKSGEGKSTILKLINKSYSANDGEILIDNYNINTLSEETIRNNISVVSQSPYIF